MFVTYYAKKTITRTVQPSKTSPSNIFDLQFTIDDYLYQPTEIIELDSKYLTTETIRTDTIPESWNQESEFRALKYIGQVIAKTEKYKNQDMHQYYDVFKIPKKSGGLRTIKAPNEELKEVQTFIRQVLEYKLNMLTHDCAFAYTKQRSVKDALVRHQQNNSKWFLKMDITNFFDNCTPELIKSKLLRIHPIYALHEKYPALTLEFIDSIIQVACLDNGLPQGTPLSPTLTNLIMTEFDFLLNKRLSGLYVYTRYADDILISSTKKDNLNFLVNTVKRTLIDADYHLTIKDEKTRYGSSAGQNWNLGLMLNKDNNITIGYRNKKRIKTMLYQLLQFPQNWSLEELQVLQGHLAYLRSIEEDYFNQLIEWFNKQHKTDILKHLNELIKSFN